MLRISKLTDYAIVLATHMATCAKPTSGRCLAELSGLPQPTVAKVLKSLSRAGVVEATRGVCGGYRLAKNAQSISVSEIIEAIDGPIAVTECTEQRSACAHEAGCGLQANWKQINAALTNALAAITLADMMSPDVNALVQLRTH